MFPNSSETVDCLARCREIGHRRALSVAAHRGRKFDLPDSRGSSAKTIPASKAQLICDRQRLSFGTGGYRSNPGLPDSESAVREWVLLGNGAQNKVFFARVD